MQHFQPSRIVDRIYSGRPRSTRSMSTPPAATTMYLGSFPLTFKAARNSEKITRGAEPTNMKVPNQS